MADCKAANTTPPTNCEPGTETCYYFIAMGLCEGTRSGDAGIRGVTRVIGPYVRQKAAIKHGKLDPDPANMDLVAGLIEFKGKGLIDTHPDKGVKKILYGVPITLIAGPAPSAIVDFECPRALKVKEDD